MLQLNKRQVKSLLDIISKEEHRHIINCVTVQEVDGKFYLVATDSYKMALLVVDSEELLEFKDKLLNREV
jgi:DNA polymerase III sliding clamp (beta) subunit (PCNA family)